MKKYCGRISKPHIVEGPLSSSADGEKGPPTAHKITTGVAQVADKWVLQPLELNQQS